MKPLAIMMVVCVLSGACSRTSEGAANSGEQAAELELMFIANEGVLVQTATKKVLIDALFNRPNPAYQAPTTEMLEKMENGQPPFDGLDLVLITHNHPDHLGPSAAGRFLLRNSQTFLVAPEDAVAAIRDSVEQWTTVSDRVVTLRLAPGTSTDTSIAGITLTAYRTLHSGQHEDPQNLMYLLEMDDRTVFHEGDSDGHPDTYGAFDLRERQIDLALVHFWYPTNLEAKRTLQEILNADHVGLFHLPISMMDEAPETIGQVASDYPDMFLLSTAGERKAFRH